MLTLAAASLFACISLTAVDGDTIKCDGVNMRLLGAGSPFVSGVDAPEIGKAKCPAERQAGEAARKRLGQLLKLGVNVEFSGKRDRFRRPLVKVRLPSGETAGERLIQEGYAKVWNPRVVVDWCADPKRLKMM